MKLGWFQMMGLKICLLKGTYQKNMAGNCVFADKKYNFGNNTDSF